MNGPRRSGGAEKFQDQKARLSELGVSHVVIHLYIGVLKIVHNFWSKFLDFKCKVRSELGVCACNSCCVVRADLRERFLFGAWVHKNCDHLMLCVVGCGGCDHLDPGSVTHFIPLQQEIRATLHVEITVV